MKNLIKIEVLTDNVAEGKEMLAKVVQERVCLYLNTHRMYDYRIHSTFTSIKQGSNTNLTMNINIEEIKCMKSV